VTIGEGYVGVPNTGSTDVRTVTVTTAVDGALTDVETQVMMLAEGSEGRLLPLADPEWRQEVLRELKAIRLGLEHMCGGSLRDD
jgi:hypothetical protein